MCLEHGLPLALLDAHTTGWVAFIAKSPLCTPRECGLSISPSSGSPTGGNFVPRAHLEPAETVLVVTAADGDVLLFCCRGSQLPQTQWLRATHIYHPMQHAFIIRGFWKSEVALWADVKVWAGLCSFSGLEDPYLLLCQWPTLFILKASHVESL